MVICNKAIKALLMYKVTQGAMENNKAKFRCDCWEVSQAHSRCVSFASMQHSKARRLQLDSQQN